MQTIIINEQKLMQQKHPLKFNRNCESSIYVLEDELYKILNLPFDISASNREYSTFLTNRKNTIIKLMQINPDGGCNPKALLTNSKYFLGCIYPYLKDYDELLAKSYSIEVRAKLCHKLNEIFRQFWKLNIQYTDLSIYNVMTNGENIKFVDMDSVSMNKFTTHEEEKRFLIFTCQQLAILSLSLLLNINIDSLNLSNYDLLQTLNKLLDNKYLTNILAYALETKFAYNPFFVDDILDKVNLTELDSRLNKLYLKR